MFMAEDHFPIGFYITGNLLEATGSNPGSYKKGCKFKALLHWLHFPDPKTTSTFYTVNDNHSRASTDLLMMDPYHIGKAI